MPERYARNEFGCIRFLQRWYVDQGWWRGQPSSCRERAAEFESASSQIVTVRVSNFSTIGPFLVSTNFFL